MTETTNNPATEAPVAPASAAPASPAPAAVAPAPRDGLSVAPTTTVSAGGGPAGARPKPALDDLEEALRDVVDPELGINVVDLGLVYGVHVGDGPEGYVATVDMTLTSAACPLTDVIEEQARTALCAGPGGGLVNDLKINWVWLPPWGPDKITDEGREQLRALGFNV